MSAATALQQLLQNPKPIVSPGAWDALSAVLIEQGGFDVVSISGAAVTASLLGLPDKSFLGLSDIFQTTLRIAQAVRIPIIVDCEDGYGTALHVIRAVREMERIGVACLCIQDKDPRTGTLVSRKEIEGKLQAALDTRKEILVMARTDAFSAQGFEEAVARARMFAAQGADIVFVDGLKEREDLLRLRDADIGVPLKYNNTIKSNGRQWSSAELYEMGFALVTYSASMQKAAIFGMFGLLRELRENDRSEGYQNQKITQSERATILGQSVWDTYGKNYVKGE